MMLNPNEAGAFWNFLGFAHKHTKGEYKLKFKDGTILECTFFTSCESENGLDLDDPNYEEYWIVCFKAKNSNYVHEVNYHTMPKEIWYDGEKVDLTKEY